MFVPDVFPCHHRKINKKKATTMEGLLAKAVVLYEEGGHHRQRNTGKVIIAHLPETAIAIVVTDVHALSDMAALFPKHMKLP